MGEPRPRCRQLPGCRVHEKCCSVAHLQPAYAVRREILNHQELSLSKHPHIVGGCHMDQVFWGRPAGFPVSLLCLNSARLLLPDLPVPAPSSGQTAELHASNSCEGCRAEPCTRVHMPQAASLDANLTMKFATYLHTLQSLRRCSSPLTTWLRCWNMWRERHCKISWKRWVVMGVTHCGVV